MEYISDEGGKLSHEGTNMGLVKHIVIANKLEPLIDIQSQAIICAQFVTAVQTTCGGLVVC